jgi:phage terminase Nu1 subunit (DNA packaging protein)
LADNEKIFLLAPMHLKRKEDIAVAFGVNPETVTSWAKDGAPIFLVGNMYQADYHALVEWLSKNKHAFKNLSSTPLPPL